MKRYTKVLMVLLVIAAMVATYALQFNALTAEIVNAAKTREARINRYVDLSKGFVDMMAIYGDDYLNTEEEADSKYFDFLKAEGGNFSMESVFGTMHQKEVGNITGFGSIPQSGERKEQLNLALSLTKQFETVYDKLPNVAWLYYTSEEDFIYMYPFISSKDFFFSPVLHEEVFYKNAAPEANPFRESVWTPVYLDHAGKGLMVTLSSPIYEGDSFKGVVSLDLTNDLLSSYLNSDYESYLVDDKNTIIAKYKTNGFNDKAESLTEVLHIDDRELEKLQQTEIGKMKRVGMHYVYAMSFKNAPWKLYYRVPVSYIIGKSALYNLPIIVMCIFLLYTFFEVIKRRKTEVLLTNSLDELRAYHVMLENAAKYDFLTSTVNRRGLKELFDKYADESKSEQIVFIMGDIDNFKKFNDKYGHAAGDTVLIKIAGIIQKSLKDEEVVCRWGGEEFVVMLVGRTYEEALELAEKIRKDIEEISIPWENGAQLKATMTFGVAESSIGEDGYKSIAKADSALYIGKEKGKNQVVGYRELK